MYHAGCDALAESSHACLFPGSEFTRQSAGRHAGRRHKLSGFHMGEYIIWVRRIRTCLLVLSYVRTYAWHFKRSISSFRKWFMTIIIGCLNQSRYPLIILFWGNLFYFSGIRNCFVRNSRSLEYLIKHNFLQNAKHIRLVSSVRLIEYRNHLARYWYLSIKRIVENKNSRSLTSSGRSNQSNSQSPRCNAIVNSTLLFAQASSPACTELETIVMNWLGKMIGLPEDFLHRPGGSGGGGVIQTTASEATLVCLLAARTRAIRDVQENDPECMATEINSRLVAYCSDQVRSFDLLGRARENPNRRVWEK